MTIDVGSVVAFRLTEHDVLVLREIARDNPELVGASDLVRRALRQYHIASSVDSRRDQNDLVGAIKELTESINRIKFKAGSVG